MTILEERFGRETREKVYNLVINRRLTMTPLNTIIEEEELLELDKTNGF
jgi:hypothetical protein